MEARLLSIERRLDTLDARFNALQDNARTIPSRHAASSTKVRVASRQSTKKDHDLQSGLLPSDADPSAIELRLLAELSHRAFSFARFIRVPHDYYHRNLEHRRHCLGGSTSPLNPSLEIGPLSLQGAVSCHQLCKSMVMENTKWIEHPSAPANAPYVMVILQARPHPCLLLRMMRWLSHWMYVVRKRSRSRGEDACVCARSQRTGDCEKELQFSTGP